MTSTTGTVHTESWRFSVEYGVEGGKGAQLHSMPTDWVFFLKIVLNSTNWGNVDTFRLVVSSLCSPKPMYSVSQVYFPPNLLSVRSKTLGGGGGEGGVDLGDQLPIN
eukprot:TRINITY_DN70105_c0_g1_i1.p1 TRINITY_DN70105_c0_g1~~TRINITY_DN70105_c0_g1_i1.p1  ORF type:complete len:107 (-),score=3.21 TRINITY_DN70105_c0_g1_i1:10-330(-)